MGVVLLRTTRSACAQCLHAQQCNNLTVVQVGLPDEQARSAILERLFSKAPKAPGVQPCRLAAAAAGMTPADLNHLAHCALSRVLWRDLKLDYEDCACSSSAADRGADLTNADLDAALASARRSVSAEEVQRYDKAEEALKCGVPPPSPAPPRLAGGHAAAVDRAVASALKNRLNGRVKDLQALVVQAAAVLQQQEEALQSGGAGSGVDRAALQTVLDAAAELQGGCEKRTQPQQGSEAR